MSASDFLRLPTGVKILVAVMFFPAIWAAVLAVFALAGDLIKPRRHPVDAVAPADSR